MRTIVVILYVMLCITSPFSQYLFESSTSVSFFTVEKNYSNETVVEFQLDKLRAQESNYSEFGRGNELSVEYDYTLQPEWGNPSLPTLQCFVKIPNTGNVSLEAYDIVSETRDGISISPFQPKFFNTHEELPYKINSTVYSHNAVYPEQIAFLSSCEIWRDIRVARVLVNPVQYNPVTRQITIIKSLKFKLQYSAGRGENELNLADPSITPSFLPLYEGVLNCDITSMRSSLSKKPGCYIFMGSKATLDGVRDLINWKTRKGYDVREAVVGSDSIAATVDAVDKWIEKIYESWKPEYIVLVGTDNVIPTKIISGPMVGGNFPADTYYGVIGTSTGNPVPSIHLGRITGNKSGTTDDPVVLKYIGWKIIKHESNPEEGEYLTKMLSWACKDQQSGDNIGSGIQKEWTATVGSALKITKGTDKVGQDNGSVMKNTDIVKTIDNGISFMTTVTHGSETSWGDLSKKLEPGFDVSHVKSLKNGTKFPFLMSLACLSGKWYKNNYCLYENFLCEGSIENPQGVVSVYGYTPMSTEQANGIISNALKNYFTNKVYSWGAAISPAKKFAVSQTDGEGGTLFGCPDIDIYTINPLKQLTVESAIPKEGKFSVTVKENGTAVEGAQVGIVSNKYAKLGSGFTNASGKVEGDIAKDMSSADSVYITVTAHNCKPVLKAVKAGVTGVVAPNALSSSKFNFKVLNNTGIQFSFITNTPTTALLKIYNVHGASIITKNFAVPSAGKNFITWSAQSNGSAMIPSGMYFVIFTFENKTFIRQWKFVQ